MGKFLHDSVKCIQLKYKSYYIKGVQLSCVFDEFVKNSMSVFTFDLRINLNE